jgi:hypothetical protein
MQVEHYGIHWEGSVAWLVQGRGASNFVGLKAQCPVAVKARVCNHLVVAAAQIPDRVHWDKMLELFPDPLVKAMLPIPSESGKSTFYVNDPYSDLSYYLSTLSRFSSPIQSVVKPIWNMKIKDLEQEMNSSNIQPLILVQASPKSQELVDMIGQMSSFAARTVIITGSNDVVVQEPMTRLTTNIREQNLNVLMTLPLESIGAAILRRYGRREQIDAQMESREDRRERQLRDRKKL